MDWTQTVPYDALVLEESPDFDEKVFDIEHIPYWRSVLDKLSSGVTNWNFFLRNLQEPLESHPIAWLQTTVDGQTLLHLAIIADQYSVIEILSHSPDLKFKRNDFGHSPIDLAQYLGKTEILSLLTPVEHKNFLDQPNVFFPDSENFPLHSLEYLPHPIFESYEVMREILTKAKKAKEEDEIPTEKVWMGIYYDNELRKQLHPSVEVRYIDDTIGFGVFAAQRIPICSFVGEYTGLVEVRKPHHLKDKYYCIRYPAWQMGKKRFVIDAEKKGTFTRFINHSDKPNLSLQSVFWKGLARMVFLSTEEILEGTQLTFHYGDIFWKECNQIPIEF